MLLGGSPRTQSVQRRRNLLRERVGMDVQGVVEAKLCRQRRNGWAMSLARVASVSNGLDAISTSQPRMLRASKSESRPELPTSSRDLG